MTKPKANPMKRHSKYVLHPVLATGFCAVACAVESLLLTTLLMHFFTNYILDIQYIN